jgi:6-phosphofructokinase 1
MKSPRRIGVLTGGGDCPGLNAVIRAVTKTAIYQYGLRVFGIEDGFEGLVENRIGELSSVHVSDILTRGGTILGSSNRATPAHYYVGDDTDGSPCFVNATDRCMANIEKNKLDALIVIGGDGTMSCTAPFLEAGITCIGIPKTIDNDIEGTDLSFGFQTAVSTATDALDRLHTTARSHRRVVVCEVMGRNAGWLALHSGVASGADVILIPEIPFDIGHICDYLAQRFKRVRGYAIIACAEGAAPIGGVQTIAAVDPTRPESVRLGGIGELVAKGIRQHAGYESRTSVLGYVQRGGPPVATDRILATQLGHHAVERLMNGARGRMIAIRDGAITDVDLMIAANKQRTVPMNDPLLRAARAVKTCFGD